MAQLRGLAQDSVCKLVQNDGLAKTLNTLRTVPVAKNPFVSSRPGVNSSGPNNTHTTSGVQTNEK